MRRSDREVTDPDAIEAVIRECTCCRLGFCDDGQAYIVPLNYGYVRREDGGYIFYFHGASEGRKIDLIRRTGRAAFELDTGGYLHRSETACGYSAAFRSVMGEGRISFVDDLEAKRTALTVIMNHMAGVKTWTFLEDMLQTVCVFQLETDTISCKEHQ